MATKKVQDFFKNKVSIRLKTGAQFKGLLSKVDNKNGIIILEDIEDLGNAYDKEQLPHDKKIAEKVFEAENIEEIVLNDKVFADPKKYKRDDFFDSMTEVKDTNPRENRERGEYKPRGGYRGRGRGDNRGERDNQNYRDNRDNRGERQYRDNRDNRGEKREGNYKAKRQNQEDDREFR